MHFIEQYLHSNHLHIPFLEARRKNNNKDEEAVEYSRKTGTKIEAQSFFLHAKRSGDVSHLGPSSGQHVTESPLQAIQLYSVPGGICHPGKKTRKSSLHSHTEFSENQPANLRAHARRYFPCASRSEPPHYDYIKPIPTIYPYSLTPTS